MLNRLGNEIYQSTCKRESSLIDSILCSANIQIIKAEYFPFGDGVGNHRPLIIYIDETSVYDAVGTLSNKIQKIEDDRPEGVKMYLQILNVFYGK